MKSLPIPAFLTGLALAAGGCVVVGDAFNPSLVGSLGFPTVGGAQQGSVVVRLSNLTDNFAQMAILISLDEDDPSIVSDQLTVPLEPGESQDIVIDCPVAAVHPAGLTNGNATVDLGSAAASVLTGEDAITDVTYTGAAPLEGSVFRCGDLLQFRLTQAAAGDDQADFRVIVQVFRGS